MRDCDIPSVQLKVKNSWPTTAFVKVQQAFKARDFASFSLRGLHLRPLPNYDWSYLYKPLLQLSYPYWTLHCDIQSSHFWKVLLQLKRGKCNLNIRQWVCLASDVTTYYCVKFFRMLQHHTVDTRGTQRQFSVKYLFGEAPIADNFLYLEEN